MKRCPILSRLSPTASLKGLIKMLQLENIEATYQEGDQILPVLHNINLKISAGEFVSLVGPSGSGKSTILKIVAGLLTPDRGRVIVEKRDVTGRIHLVGYMPQKDMLLPWKRLAENAALPLLAAGVPKKAALEKVNEMLPLFGLTGFGNYYPDRLSGGMRQRGALLRTMLTESNLLLLDEPFAALDALTRVTMQNWLLRIWNRFRRTVLLVTHSIDEAIYLSDRVYVITKRPGEIALEEIIGLARPRSGNTLSEPGFTEHKRKLLSALEDLTPDSPDRQK